MNALRYLSFAPRLLRRAGPPLHLTLFVTGRCNLRCRHCFHWKEVAEGRDGPSLAELKRLADSCAQLGPLLWVSFGGGEPFLRDDLAQAAAAFGAHGLRHLAIPTNGLVARQYEQVEEILAACPETFLSVSVSFDGPPEIHDRIRQCPGGHARSSEAVRRLRAQREALPPEAARRLGIGVLVTVTSENQDVMAGHMEELVRELGPDNVTINLARSDALDRSLLEVDLARYQEVVETKARLVREGELPYFDFPLAGLARRRDELMYEQVHKVASAGGNAPERGHLPCTAGELSAVIFENGEVHPCEVLGKSIGNLHEVDWDLGRLWTGERARELRRDIRRERCACTWECAQADNVLFAPRRWPSLLAGTLGS